MNHESSYETVNGFSPKVTVTVRVIVRVGLGTSSF